MSIIADTIKIKIDGKEYEDYVFSDIQLVQEPLTPNVFRFLMQKKNYAENEKDIRETLAEKLLGKSVEFYIKTKRDDKEKKAESDDLEFKGIIFQYNFFRQEMEKQYAIEVIAFSPDNLLNDSPHCFSYEDKTLKDITADVVSECDVTFKNDPHITDSLLYTVRYNETSYAFLVRLAFRFGEWLYYNGTEFVFGKIKKSDTIELQPNVDILDYNFKLGLDHLNFKHSQHNYLTYENTGNTGVSFTDGNIHNLTDVVYSKSKDIYKKETFEHLKASSSEENSFDETEIAAKVKGLGKKGRMTICHGRTTRADLKIGSVIKIKVDIKDADGKTNSVALDELMIYKITHYANTDGSYENEFTAMAAECDLPPYSFGELFPKIETQRAVVKKNNDPEKLGRVRVQFIWQKEQDEELMTPWIRIAQPHGGNNKGFYFIPEIDEEVMVGFENGNAEKPYIIGTLYQKEQKPGENWYDEDNNIKAIRTRNGHTVEINDVEDGGFIKIYDHEDENYIITLSTDDKLIKLESKGNIELHAENDIIMEAKNNINIKAEKDMTVNVEGDKTTEITGNDSLSVTGDIENTAKGKMKIDATGDYQLEAMNVKQKSKAALNLEAGSTAELKASASGTVDGGGSLTLKGGTTSIN
jgi:uncharacterized protein involved in type VI secretion and phage assembly